MEYTFGHGIPLSLDRALAARKGGLEDVKIRWMLALRPLEIVKADPGHESFTFMCWHFSGLDRRYCDEGLVHYIPLLYRNKPRHYRQMLEVDVCMVAVTPMDKHGYFNLATHNSATRAQIEKAKTVIVEVNEKFPVCLGGREETVRISEVDFVVEGENPDLVELPRLTPTEVDKTLARLIVEQIRDGSTIQFGIGGMPDTIGRMLCDSDLKDLGMHARSAWTGTAMTELVCHQHRHLGLPHDIFRGRPEKQPGSEAVATPSDHDQVRIMSFGCTKQGF